jgi:hypothetical protein
LIGFQRAVEPVFIFQVLPDVLKTGGIVDQSSEQNEAILFAASFEVGK